MLGMLKRPARERRGPEAIFLSGRDLRRHIRLAGCRDYPLPQRTAAERCRPPLPAPGQARVAVHEDEDGNPDRQAEHGNQRQRDGLAKDAADHEREFQPMPTGCWKLYIQHCTADLLGLFAGPVPMAATRPVSSWIARASPGEDPGHLQLLQQQPWHARRAAGQAEADPPGEAG